jgi:hypothetical protein
MSGAGEAPVPYRVVYSGRVRTDLRALMDRALALNRGRAVADAVKAIDTRLRIYPQFGQPLRELATEEETLWVGTVPPLVVHYVIDDERRLVFVVHPFKPLPGLGL